MRKVGSDFVIKICSDCDFEELVADIYWKNYPFAMLNYDKGPENIEIELYSPPEGKASWSFSFKECVEVFEEAKSYLLGKD
jgi:hypothetical protein